MKASACFRLRRGSPFTSVVRQIIVVSVSPALFKREEKGGESEQAWVHAVELSLVVAREVA